MPLIEIEALPQPPEVDPVVVTRAVNAAVARALGARLDAVWTVWRTIDGAYAQGDSVVASQPRETHAPIVHVFLKRTPAETEAVVEAIATVLMRELTLDPGNVFITTQPVEIPRGEG